MLPRISIVVPSYQQGQVIDTTLRSLVEQDYPDFEVLVMDGGSDDGTVDVIERYGSRLAHWQSAPDEGQAAAIAEGFERSTGEVLCWVNSDDLLLPGALLVVGSWFEADPARVVGVGHALKLDADARPLRRWYATTPSFKRLLFGGSNPGFAQPACFWRRSAYAAVGGVDPAFDALMDLDLYLRLASRYPIERIDEFLAAYRAHPGQKSQVHPALEAERRRIRERYRYHATPQWMRWLYRRLARWHRRSDERRGAVSADVRDLDPEGDLAAFLEAPATE